jgi:hypothetical protein
MLNRCVNDIVHITKRQLSTMIIAIARDKHRVDLRHGQAPDQGHQGALLQGTGMTMAFKLIDTAQERWRAVNAPHLVALVRAGARFECGKLVERDPALEATQAADDTPVQSPTASNQPINNAA